MNGNVGGKRLNYKFYVDRYVVVMWWDLGVISKRLPVASSPSNFLCVQPLSFEDENNFYGRIKIENK